LATTQESFDALLVWLDPDREVAGQKYETIRTGLIRIFVSRGFSDAEDLADETIDRVMKRLPDIQATYEGPPAKYFIGVARYIIKERNRLKEIATDEFPVQLTDASHESDAYDCLLQCLKFLSRENHHLILDYYSYSGHDKVETHREMANELGITENALRLRAHHIRAKLKQCVRQCVESLKRKQNGSDKP
jgi:RNA polymerase sigma factor (sigma-70 family)